MKKLYKRACWYIVDGWICDGYIDKYGFHLTQQNFEDAAYKLPWMIKKKNLFFSYDKALREYERRYGHSMLIHYFRDSCDIGYI